jgi:hypothetical protein
MNAQNLPQNYEGYSTKELLDLWQSIPQQTLESPPEPKGKIRAMRRLLMDYRLAPVEWGFVKEKPGHSEDQEKTDMVQAKRLLAPFGIDPAPWVDQEGNYLPEGNGQASS